MMSYSAKPSYIGNRRLTNSHDLARLAHTALGNTSKLGGIEQGWTPSLVLYVVSTYSNSVLFYGLESQRFSKASYNSICYTYNCAYTILFTTFEMAVITLSQFVSGEVPSE